MPAQAKSVNAFNLRLLRLLINLKINQSYYADLTRDQKKELCYSYTHVRGSLEISHSYLEKIWPAEGELKSNISLATLNQLCNLIREDYLWPQFVQAMVPFEPKGIISGRPYSELNAKEKNAVDESINNFIQHFTIFDQFQDEIIDQSEIQSNVSYSPSERITLSKHIEPNKNLIVKEEVYVYGGLDVVFLNDSTVRVTGSHKFITGFGFTLNSILGKNAKSIVISVKVEKFRSYVGNTFFKLYIDKNLLKSLPNQTDFRDPCFTVYNENFTIDYNYIFPIPDWLIESKNIRNIEIVFAPMKDISCVIKTLTVSNQK